LGKVAVRRKRWQVRIRVFHGASDQILEARMPGEFYCQIKMWSM